MNPAGERRGAEVERDGWRLTLALPPELAASRDALIAFVLAAAGGRVAAPMRRSRHACTYQVQFVLPPSAPINLFIKVLEPPKGKGRLKRIFRGSSSRHVARVTAELAAAGLSAPPVWLYGHEAARRRELLVTPRAEGYGPLQTLAGLVGDVAAKRALLRALGGAIARLHRAAFVHGDLTPFNIFIVRSEPPRFILLDHERTRRSSRLGRTRRQLRNLVQLGRFDLPGLSRADRFRLLAAYVAALAPHNARARARRINAMLVRRLRRDGGPQVVSLASPATVVSPPEVAKARA